MDHAVAGERLPAAECADACRAGFPVEQDLERFPAAEDIAQERCGVLSVDRGGKLDLVARLERGCDVGGPAVDLKGKRGHTAADDLPFPVEREGGVPARPPHDLAVLVAAAQQGFEHIGGACAEHPDPLAVEHDRKLLLAGSGHSGDGNADGGGVRFI